MAIKSAKDFKREDAFIKTLVLGDMGTGKSIFASTFPTPGFVFDFDNGVITYAGKDFDYGSYDMSAKGWVEFEKDFLQVKKDVAEGKYKTVVFDSTTSCTDCAMARALQLDPKRSPSDGPLWNVHYQIVKNLVEGKLRQLLSLKCNIVLISHIKIVRDEETGAILSIDPLLTGDLSQKVPGYFDEVYFAFCKQKDGKPHWFIQTAPKGMYKARSRISGIHQLLPLEIPNTYQDLMKAIEEGEKKRLKQG